MRRILHYILFLLTFLFFIPCLAQTNDDLTDPYFTPDNQIIWGTTDGRGNAQIALYFFWSKTCPHCTLARPVIEQIGLETPWLRLHSFSIEERANKELYIKMAEMMGQDASSVPGFLFCGVMRVGFDETTTPTQLRQMLDSCHQFYQGLSPNQAAQAPVLKEDNLVNLPGFGVVDTQDLSLPLLTLVLAGLDSFNPCAFFVLLFLLSLLVHARNRKRMALIGGLFISVSGLIYFLFMAAWLNLFMLIGDSRWITLSAGVIAIVIAVLNIKDYFHLHQGVTLSIPESAKPGLFQRMRGLLSVDSLPTMISGTIVLAVVANSYELLCTAGFPMVYTRALTLHQLSDSEYYLYLLAYNVIYVVPLLVITLIFIFTLGSRKLKEHEGRALKLMSGSMMLGLGVILVVAPQMLNNILVAVTLLAAALLVTAFAMLSRRN
jgi:hypothetical protein